MKNYMKFSRFEICEALDTSEFDNVGEAALNCHGETFATLNHWSIYRFYAEVFGIYPIAESKYWLLYDVDAFQELGGDDLFEMMSEDDCVPYESYGETYEELMDKFLRSDIVDFLELNYFRK